MKIEIDTIQKKCKVTFCKEDTNHVNNMLLLKQTVTMGVPDSRFSIHIEDGWDFEPLGELESLANDIGFDVAMKYGDVEITGTPEVTNKFKERWDNALNGTNK